MNSGAAPTDPSDPVHHRVLVTPLGFNLAEVTRMIEVARALPPTVEPVFLVHDAGYDHLVDEAGFRRLPGSPSLSPAERELAIAADQGHTWRHPFTRERVAHRVETERRALRTLGAGAVLHGTNPTAPISARAEGVPLVYPVPYPWSVPQLAGRRPLPLVLDRGAGRVLNRALTPVVGRLATRVPGLLPRSFREVAAAHGVRLRGIFDLLGADVTLLTCLEEELEGAALPPGHHLVGPIFAHLDGEVPPLVRELAAGPRPLVYLAFGSSGNRRLALRAMAALAEEDVEVVAPLRQYLRPGDEARVPANVHLVDLLPAHRLGGLVDAAILHGGQGTVQTACATAVPFLGIGQSAEQRWNVDVCVRAGHAEALGVRDLRPGGGRFRAALHRVLHDPAVRARAEEAARRHRAVDGAARSAAVITQVLEERSAT